VVEQLSKELNYDPFAEGALTNQVKCKTEKKKKKKKKKNKI
jgi:hypothetical protein